MRASVLILFSITAWFGVVTSTHAQNLYEKTTLHIIVITSPGGQADIVARIISEGLQKSLERSVIVENKPGAGGNIAEEYVARSAPDGTTILLTSNNHTINPTLFHGKVGYDWQKSFEPVIQLTRGPSVVAVNPELKATSIAELMNLSKTTSLSYGSTGIGSAGNLAFEMLKKAEGAENIVHVPYRGAAPAVADAFGGHIKVLSVSLTSAIPFIKTGKLRALAVTTKNRWPEAPEIPTLRESGCSTCVYETYLGILAPAKTTKTYVDELNRQIALILKDPAHKDQFDSLGVAPVGDSPDEFKIMLENDHETAAKVILETGMTLD